MKSLLIIIIPLLCALQSVGQNGHWNTEISELPLYITAHSSAESNGTIYMIGGYRRVSNNFNQGISSDLIFSYNAEKNTWDNNVGKLDIRRGYLGSVILGTKMYVLGGFGGLGDKNMFYNKNKMDAMNLITRAWEMGDSLSPCHYQFSLINHNNLIYKIGGTYNSLKATDEFLQYDPNTRMWVQLKTMPTPLVFPSTIGYGDQIYVFGGTSDYWEAPSDRIYIYDIIRNSWKLDEITMPDSLSRMAICEYNGFFYLFGGTKTPIRSQNPSIPVKSVYMYDPITKFWQTPTELPVAMWGITAHEVNGKIFLVGGNDGKDRNDVEIENYRPPINVYTPIQNPIYSIKTEIANSLLCPENDLNIISASIINHNKLPVKIRAHLEGALSKEEIDIELFDKGKNGDLHSNDGVYTNHLSQAVNEDYYKISIVSHNLINDEEFSSGFDCRPVSSIGPVTVPDYSLSNREKTEDGEVVVSFSLILQNNGKIMATEELSIELFTTVSTIQLVNSQASCESISPQQQQTSRTEFSFIVSPKHPAGADVPIHVSIEYKGYSYWNDIVNISFAQK